MPYYIDEEHSDILFEVNGDQVAFKESNPGSGGSGGNLPYVIQEKDATTPTDRNLFSSKRVLAEVAKGSQSLQDEYLSKKKDDRTPHLLSSDKGFEVGEFVTGESGGKVWLDAETLKVLIELDRVTARQYIDIGEARLEYDSQNHAIRVTNRATNEDGNPIASIGLYAEGFVSAKGASSGGQGGGGGASALYGLNDVLRNEAGDGVMGASAGKVLMFNGTHWYAGDAKGKVVAVKIGQEEYKPSEEGIVTLPEFAKVVDKSITVDKFIGDLQGNADTATKLKNALTIQKNKTEVGVFDGSEAKTVNIDVPTKVSELENDSKFLTEHQKLYALTIQGNGKQLGVYTPNEAAKSINITPSGIGAAASSHTHVISDVTNLQASLDSKLNASIFTELFEKVLLSDGVTYAIRAKYGFYSDSFVSAKGANPSSGGSAGGAASIYVGSTLYTPDGEGIIHLPAYPTVPTSLKNPYALTIQKNGITQGVYDGSTEKSVNITVPTKVSELTNDSNFLTAHQKLYELTIQGNGTSLGTYTPNSEAKTINLTAASIGAAAASHTHNYLPLSGGTLGSSSVGNTAVYWASSGGKLCIVSDGTNGNFIESGNVDFSGNTTLSITGYYGNVGSYLYLKFANIYCREKGYVNLDSGNYNDYAAAKEHTHVISDVTDLQTKLDDKYSSSVSRTANTVLAAPNGSAGVATFRKLVSADIPSLDWSKITSGKPTTLAGYGIADGVNSVTVSGSGNAVTYASVSGHGLTLTKGETFLAKSIFDDLFEKVLLSDGTTYAIRAKYGFYSDSFVSAKGSNSEISGGGGIGSIYVGTTQYNADSEGIVRLPAYPTIPTSLKNPYALTIQANGTTLVIYDGSAAKTFNLTYANVGAAAASHKQAYTANECTTYTTDDNTMGVTPAAVKKAIGLFDPKEHAHNSLGTLTVGSSSHPVYFNAGVPTAVDKTATFNALVNSTTIGYSTPVDADYYISQSVDGGTSITTYHRRSHSALYAYLKGKAEGTWGINVSGYAGALYKANYITNLNSPIWGITDGYSINYNNCDSTVSNAPSRIDNANLIMNIQHGKHNTSGQYGWQVGFFHSLNAPYVRKWTGGSVGSWIKLLTSGNYNEFAPSKDGTGASGTWDINVSGNADTATKLNNYYNARPSNANLSPDGSGGMCKFLATSTMTSNRPTVDGHILHLFWDTTAGWDAQLMIPNNGNSSYEPQWRGQNNGTWSSWISFVTSGTIGSYNAGSATKLQTARTIWGQSFNGTANVSGTITGSYFKINDSSTSPYLWLNGWYVQVNNSMLQMGNATEYSIKVDSSGNLILPTSSRRIYFNGSTSDNQCIVYDNSSGRLSVGSSAAKGFNVGDLLVSSAWADYTLVPTNGIYSKGDIYSAGAITAKSSSSDIRLKCDLTEYDALSIVNSQRSVMYHWNETAKRNSEVFNDNDWHYGLIAQELQREHPQLVKDVFGDYLTIDYERLIPILWRAVQQLAKRNEELEMKLNEERRA